MKMRRLSTDVSEPELAEALASTDFQAQAGQIRQPGRGEGSPVKARRLAQTTTPQIGVGNVSTDLGCDGCAGSDNRVQVLRSSLSLPLYSSVLLPMQQQQLMPQCLDTPWYQAAAASRCCAMGTPWRHATLSMLETP